MCEAPLDFATDEELQEKLADWRPQVVTHRGGNVYVLLACPKHNRLDAVVLWEARCRRISSGRDVSFH